MDKTDHELLLEIHQTLMGVDDQPGLCQQHENLKRDYYKFKTAALAVFFTLIGSGILGVGVTSLLKTIK